MDTPILKIEQDQLEMIRVRMYSITSGVRHFVVLSVPTTSTESL